MSALLKLSGVILGLGLIAACFAPRRQKGKVVLFAFVLALIPVMLPLFLMLLGRLGIGGKSPTSYL